MRYQAVCFCRLALLLLPTMIATAAPADDSPPPAPPAQTILHLSSGSFAAGTLVDSPTPTTLRWQADGFVTPFEFPIEWINAIHWPPPAKSIKPGGDYAFELAAGDVLFGSLVDLNDTDVEIETSRLGRFKIDRKNVHRIFRWRDSSDLVYLGPNGLTGWKHVSPASAKDGCARNRDNWSRTRKVSRFAATLEFPLAPRSNSSFPGEPSPISSWRSGSTTALSSLKRAFRFEAWGGDLVIERELESEADLARVQEIVPGPGRIHLHVFLDQERGHLLVFSQGGKKLAELELAGPKPVALPGLALTNLRGDLRLEWLRIGRWSGELPREVDAKEARIHRGDGTIAYGHVSRFDAKTREFVVKSASGESSVPADQVTSVFLSLPSEDRPRALRAVYPRRRPHRRRTGKSRERKPVPARSRGQSRAAAAG